MSPPGTVCRPFGPIGRPDRSETRPAAPGGGGHGDPRRREPALVAADVADGLISRESAEEDYGVTLPSAKAGD